MHFPHEYKVSADRCVIRIDDSMYDVSNFRHTHPGGAELLDMYHNKDASDVFYAFHSKQAIKQLKNMRGKPAGESDPHRDQVSLAFEKLRKNLEMHGWFDRNLFADIFMVILPFFTFFVLGNVLAWSHPWIATLCLGVAMQQAGWMGHDYGHGRGEVSRMVNLFLGGFVNGFSSEWWSHKHNTHHAFPNRLGVDSDIHNEPILHLFFPAKDKDTWFRKYQHYYYMIVYAFLYFSWRLQSILFVIGSKKTSEIALLVAGYAWLLLWLPIQVSVGSVLLGGWLVAVVVTSNHQPEPMLETNAKYNFIVDQCVTTRGVICPDWVTEYLFGGMQYQLEHHLFPIMPKYRYRAVRPIVQKFIEENGMEFKVSGIVDIMQRNYDTMKKFSQ